MKNVLFLFFAFIYCTRDLCISHPPTSPPPPPIFDFGLFNDAQAQLVEVITEPRNPSTTPISSSTVENDLDDISIQDILSSDIDASEKIERKIINAISEFSSNCNIYKRIDLSLRSFVFPKNTINVNLELGNVSFYNFDIKEESDTTGYKRKSYSTLIGCDSSKKAKVEVTLPNHIKITANVKVTEIANSPNKLIYNSASEGSITVVYKNNSFLKQFSFQNNDSKFEDEITKKLSYFRTEVFLDLDTKYQKIIHNNLEAFFNETESSLEQFFVQELNAELTKNNISVGLSCSKFINMENNTKKINALFLKNDLNNLYVLSNVSLETWKGVSISVGPIVIQGLSHFNSTELSVSGNEESSASHDGYYHSTPSSYDPEKKQITAGIKTNALKGKLDWSYNLKRRSFSFFVDFIKFEVKKRKSYSYTEVDRFRYHYSYDDSNSHKYTRREENDIDVNVYLGNIQIKSSKSTTCENEKEFVNFVLSEYLKTVLKNSLKNSLDKKLRNNDFVINYC